MTRPPPSDPDAHRPAVLPRDGREAGTAPDDVLARLIRLVGARARSLGADGEASREVGLQGLRQAVTALDHHVEALELLDAAEAERASRLRAAAVEPTATDGLHRGDTGETADLPDGSPLEPGDLASSRPPGAPGPDVLPGESEAGGDREAATRPEAAGRHEAPGRPAPGGAYAPGGDDEGPADPTSWMDPPADYPPYRDQVTGLHSREGFDAVAGGELKRCRRYGRVYSLLLLRLPTSDVATLQRGANAVRTATRESDLIGRHRDRTVAIALPETQATQARLVAERVIGHLEGVGAWGDEGRLGLVTHPLHGETLLQLIEAARGHLAKSPRQVLASHESGVWPD